MKTIDFSYFIERYNAGEMDETEKLWFQKEIAGNQSLREEVDLRRKTDLILKKQDSLKLRNKLHEIEMRRAAAETEKSSARHNIWKYAAVIACLVILGSIPFITGGKKLTNEEIIGKYYSSFEGVSPSRSQQADVNQNFSRGLDYYNVHDFRNAAIYFGKVLNDDPKYIESTMYFGVSKYENKDYTEAARKFRIVTKDANNLFIEDAEWYLALCYLQNDEKENATRQLQMIKNSGSIYSKQAGKILRKIK